MSSIDKSFVKKSFNACASTYDSCACLQKRLVEQLLSLLDVQTYRFSRILDVGTGTGNLFAGLSERFPAAQVFGCDLAVNMLVCARRKLFSLKAPHYFAAADAELLPYKNDTFDLVASSFTYQWLDSWNSALDEVKRVLKPGSVFLFSAFGEKTFFELRQSYRKACAATGYTKGEALELSITEEKIRNTLAACGFCEPWSQAYSVVETYTSVPELIRAIKGMGARNASDRRNKTPGVKRIWKRMIELYMRDFGMDNKIPATFEIILGKAES